MLVELVTKKPALSVGDNRFHPLEQLDRFASHFVSPLLQLKAIGLTERLNIVKDVDAAIVAHS